MNLDGIQEVQDFIESIVRKDKHVLGESFQEGEEASLGIKPSVCSKFLVVRLKRLDDSSNTKSVVSFGTIKSSNNQVNDTEMENLSVRLLQCDPFLFLLKAFHEFFGFLVLRSHDIGDAKVSKHDSCDGEQVVHLFPHDGFIISDSVSELLVLHEEHMRHVKFPSIVFRGELSRLSEDLFNLVVVAHVPVDLSLHHEHRDVLIESLIVLLKSCIDLLAISSDSGILDQLSFLSQNVDMLVSQFFELSVSLFF